MLGSNELDTINNMNVYDIYKDLCLGEKEHEQKLLKDIHWSNEKMGELVPKM